MQCYQLVFQGTLALVHAQALKMFKRFCYFISIGVLVFWFETGLIGVAFAYALSLLVPVIFYAPLAVSRFRALIKGREGGHYHFIEAVWERGRWSICGELLATSVASMWPWIIGYYLSVADIGYISIANMILGQIASLAPISFVLRSVLPRTLGVEGRTRAWLVRSMKYAIWSQVIGGLVIMVAVYFFIPLLYPAYVFVVPLVAVLLITLPVRAVGTVASEWFFALRRQRSLFFISNLPKLFLIALLPPLLAWWGMFGFVVYTLISTEVFAFLRLRLIARDQGGYITLREMLIPDAEDSKVLRRSFDAFMQIRAAGR
jgi:O-antigen/teichoic acid export membrane protein